MAACEGVNREPRLESDRIGIRKCTWKYHVAFVDDAKRIRVDHATWQAIKTMMFAAADGTARDVIWEFPCESSHGSIGELKHEEQDEVQSFQPNCVGVETAEIHYRVYFSEPKLCPEELWAMGLGVKSHHPEFVGTDQQSDIELASLRASQSGPTGNGLRDLTP